LKQEFKIATESKNLTGKEVAKKKEREAIIERAALGKEAKHTDSRANERI